MNKTVIIAAAVIVLAAALLLGLRRTEAPTLSTSTVSTSSSSVVESPLPKVTAQTGSIKDDAWEIFEKYLDAAEKHNLAALTAVSYQISATCKDPAKREECNGLMNNAFNYGSQFRKDEMTHIVAEGRQIILTSDYHKNLEGEAPSITRGIIYFVRDANTIKFLSFKPFDGAFIVRAEDMSTSTIESRLEEMVKDSDSDTLPDEIELCKGDNTDPNCVKTNPNRKDSDGDGWWDAIEALFYK